MNDKDRRRKKRKDKRKKTRHVDSHATGLVPLDIPGDLNLYDIVRGWVSAG